MDRRLWPLAVRRAIQVTCDVVHIDGSHHSGDDPLADIENFAALATPRFRRLIVDEAACGPSWCQHTSKVPD